MKAYCLNNISPVALAGLKNNDVIVEDIIDADSILVRSAKMHEVDFRLRNSFFRITLVNREKSERLTIDFDINFENCVTGNKNTISKLCIVEVKQDGNAHSHFKDYLMSLRIKRRSVSKYCLGMVLTDPSIKYNRFKEKVRYIEKL